MYHLHDGSPARTLQGYIKVHPSLWRHILVYKLMYTRHFYLPYEGAYDLIQTLVAKGTDYTREDVLKACVGCSIAHVLSRS